MSKQPKLNITLYSYLEINDEVRDIVLHSHVYLVNNTIEIIRYNGYKLSRPFPVLSQKALYELITEIERPIDLSLYALEMLIFTGEQDILQNETYPQNFVINNTPPYQSYDNPISDFMYVEIETQDDYKEMYMNIAEKIWNILH